MATVKFLLQSKKTIAPINLRLSIRRDKVLKRKIGREISKKDWSISSGFPLPRNAELKVLREDLRELERFVIKACNQDLESRKNIDGKWLQHQIDLYFKRIVESTAETSISELVTDNIQRVIDTASTRENSRGGLGISKSRINSYKTLKSVFRDYEGKKNFKIKDVDIRFAKDFMSWLLNERGYAESYARKRMDDLKTVCLDAEIQGIKVSPQLKKVKGGKAKNDFIIYLTPSELQKIKEKELEEEYLENTRKWLLLGCNIGQRGGDLLSITQSNFVTRNNLELIELTQQKTGKKVTIPVLPGTKEILKDGLPHKISMQKFNEYLKDLCRISGINELTKGSKIKMVEIKSGREAKRRVKGEFEKWELITSHVCRRTFATKEYGTLPTPLIMQITGHSSEKTFLGYIGKTGIDYAQQIADFYKKRSLGEAADTSTGDILNT